MTAATVADANYLAHLTPAFLASPRPRRRTCRRCDGTGRAHVHELGMTTCPECNGTGRTPDPYGD